MTERKYPGALSLIAWGTLLLFVNITVGNLNLLPNWLGYLLICRALPAVGEEEPEALLLKPLCAALALWEGLLWLLLLFGTVPDWPVVRLAFSVIFLYFDFQLLSNLASTAQRHGCQEEKSLRRLRNIRAILNTLLALPFGWETIPYFSSVMIVVCLAAGLWTCCVLFAYRRSEEALEPAG